MKLNIAAFFDQHSDSSSTSFHQNPIYYLRLQILFYLFKPDLEIGIVGYFLNT